MPTTIGALPVTDSVTGTKIDLEPAQEVIPQADIGLVAQANDQGGIDLQETGQVKAGASDIDTMFADISEGEYVVIRIGEEEFRGLYGGKDDFGTNIELGSLGIDWWRSIHIPIS